MDPRATCGERASGHRSPCHRDDTVMQLFRRDARLGCKPLLCSGPRMIKRVYAAVYYAPNWGANHHEKIRFGWSCPLILLAVCDGGGRASPLQAARTRLPAPTLLEQFTTLQLTASFIR
jgi:hypothetical protein